MTKKEARTAIKEGYFRGTITIKVEKNVPLYHAILALLEFDKEVHTLWVGSIRGNIYKVEMNEDLIRVSKQ